MNKGILYIKFINEGIWWILETRGLFGEFVENYSMKNPFK